MRRLLAVAATITAVTVPSGTEPASTESTPTPQEFPTLRSTAAQRDAVSITVYNQNFGLVREIRTLDLPSGRIALEYGDVASGIQPETVYIRPIGGGPLQVLEQNYQFDLLSPQKLLEKYVGRTVNVYRTNPQTGVDKAVEEIDRFYRHYHSIRYADGDYTILRLTRAPTPELMAHLNERYRDLLADGDFESLDTFHPSERRESEAVRNLPRIGFKFVRRRLGRLRRMIDEINLAELEGPKHNPPSGSGAWRLDAS